MGVSHQAKGQKQGGEQGWKTKDGDDFHTSRTLQKNPSQSTDVVLQHGAKTMARAKIHSDGFALTLRKRRLK
jgi:hypothetical protein